MTTVLQWIWQNIWTLAALFVLFRYGARIYKDLIFTPLAGGNGKVQMDELAKAIILGTFVLSATVEAFRAPGTPQVFSNEYYFALLLSVCAIAAIKPAFGNMKNFKNDLTETKKNETP